MVKELPVIPVAFVIDSLEGRQREIEEQGQKGLADLVEYTLPRLHQFDEPGADEELLRVDFRVRDMRNAYACDVLRNIPLIGARVGDIWIGVEYLRVQDDGTEVAVRPIANVVNKVRSGLTRMAMIAACITHI